VSELARLVVPALRHDAAHGFGYLDGLIDDALELGVGGFLIEGGARADVAALVGRLHAESRHPILVALRAERGAGDTIEGLTQLPPLGAVARVAVVAGEGAAPPSLDVDAVRRVARITARDARNVGANWALAPVCDLDVARGFARVGMRGASDDPAIVAAIVSEWVDACQAEATLACAMHFPGLGHAQGDDNDPVVALSEVQLRHGDLVPFAAAIDAGVASVMVSPASLPGLDAQEGAMRSASVIENVLRAALGFDGLAATVPLDREPGIHPADEAAQAVVALIAGCDVVLAPSDLDGTVEALERAAKGGALSAVRVRAALDRVNRWSGWARPTEAREPGLDDVMWSRQLADRTCMWLSGGRPRIGATLEVVSIGTPMPHVAETLRAMHVEVMESANPTPKERAPLVVCFAPPIGPGDGVGRVDLDKARLMAKEAITAGRDAAIVAACHPRAAAGVGRDLAVVCVWEPTRAMQQAAARALVTAR
jgi:beta-glucosidase-like glycosyl hydrolase